MFVSSRNELTLTYFFFCWALVLALTMPVSARWPQPALDVAELVARADVIVVGREAAVQDLRPATPLNNLPGRLTSITVNATLVIKGPNESRFDYTDVVWGTDQPLRPRSPDPSERIFFMRKTAAGLQAATDFYSSVVGSSRAAITRTLSPLQAVVASIAAVIGDRTAPDTRRLEAIRTLRGTTSRDAVAPLRFAMTDSSAAVRTQAAIDLTRKNEIDGLSIVDDLLAHSDSRNTNFVEDALAAVRDLKREEAIPAADRWIASANVRVRRAGAEVLRQSGSNQSLPGLARCLLDEDFEVRYDAVAGLAEITGQLTWRPDFPTFQLSTGARYLDYWKSWARGKGLIREGEFVSPLVR